jgi:protease secretion system membrane fusion protein
MAQSQHATVRSQFLVSAASEARLLAERTGQATIRFPQELLAEQEIPEVKEAMASQILLFNSRRDALRGESAILRESIAGLRQQIIGLQAQAEAKKTQMELLREQATSLRDLTRDGFYPRNRLLEIERSLAQVSGEHSDILANLASSRNQIAELELRILQRRQEFQREVETELAQVQRDTGALRERLTAVTDELQRIVIQAPVDGMVVGLRVHTQGGVIAPGATIMDIAPLNEPLIIEARVAPHLIDRVHAGLAVKVMFPAFNASTTPTVEGRVRSISADLVPDPNPQLPAAYLAHIEVTPESMKKLGTRQIRTGMPADVVITTGERTLLGYLLKPLTNRIAVSFKEE